MDKDETRRHYKNYYQIPAVIAPQVVAMSFAIILVVARVYTRFKYRRFWWDDVLIILGLVSWVGLHHTSPRAHKGLQIFAILVLCAILAGIHFGIGNHTRDLSPSQLKQAAIWEFIPRTAFVLASMFTRLSISCFLLRIFAVDKRWRWSLYFTMCFIVLTSIPSAFLLFAQCRPTRKLWNPMVPGVCWAPATSAAIGLTFNGGKIFKSSPTI